MGEKFGIVSGTLSLTFLLICITDSVLSDVPPVIREAPREQIVRAGGTAAFLCITTGDPTPHITWRKNGNKISLSTSRYDAELKKFQDSKVPLYRFNLHSPHTKIRQCNQSKKNH